jgi:hypothetical protein
MMTKSIAILGKALAMNGGMVLNKSEPRRKLGKVLRNCELEILPTEQ